MKAFADDLKRLLTRHEIRVAVCGMQNSGKTVFITSLADHILNHNPSRDVSDDNRRFDLGAYVVVDADVEDIHPPDDAIGNFDFRTFRNSFANDAWPEKTARTTEIALDFTLENVKNPHCLIPVAGSMAKRRDVRLRILDIPGERLADFIMDGRDFAEWSDALLGNGRNRRRHLDAYRDGAETAVGQSDGDAAETVLLSEYRKALDAARGVFDRFVTPSVYRVPLDGSVDSPRLAGLPDKEFAPMTASLRKRFPALAKKFARHYDAYRDLVVAPIVDWMKTADKALFLLDVFSCLNGGSQAYNSALAETNAALDVFASKGTLGDMQESIGYLFTRFQLPMDPKNIRIVVTKMDLADDVGKENLKALAQQMFGTKAQSVTGVDSPDKVFLACAAVVTDESGGSEAKKRLYPGIPGGRSDARPGDGIPRTIPKKLDEWYRCFVLKDKNPPFFNLREDLPPRHAGLDEIARFVLGIPKTGKTE